MIRKLAGISGITFALVFAWKVALLLVTSQPVPANDSFFYDGPVVNYLLHGGYVNPSLARVLPISATQVFSAYPPLYHLVLLGWMKVSGTGALSQMWFHVLLFGAFELVLLGIFCRLKTPAVCVNIAGLFLFSITFHDRPDSLAHVLGMAAVYAAIRSRRTLDSTGDDKQRTRWTWLGVALNVLTLCTSLQIGGFYLVLVWLMRRLCKLFGREAIPRIAALATWLVPVALVCCVKFGHPQLWAGFREHAQLTPTFLGFHVPRTADVLKILRTVPAVLLIAFCIRWAQRSGGVSFPNRFLLVLIPVVAVSLMIVLGALSVLTANLVAVANYAQPLVVGCLLAVVLGERAERKLPRVASVAALALVLLVSIRGIGMTTWGALCARDMDYQSATRSVNETLDSLPLHSTVLVSSAFLYDVARRDNLIWLHSDWPSPPSSTNPGWVRDALVDLKPAALVLTQFDYYRRYQHALNELTNQPVAVTFTVRNPSRFPSPDSIPSMQKIVQHVSWSPVIVEFSWKETPGTK